MTAWVERVEIGRRVRVHGGRRARGLVGVSRARLPLPSDVELREARRRTARLVDWSSLDSDTVALLVDALRDLDRQFAHRVDRQETRRQREAEWRAVLAGAAPRVVIAPVKSYGRLRFVDVRLPIGPAVVATGSEAISLQVSRRVVGFGGVEITPATTDDERLVAERVASDAVDVAARILGLDRSLIVAAAAAAIRELDERLGRVRAALAEPRAVDAGQAGGTAALVVAGLCGALLGPVSMERAVAAVKHAARGVSMPRMVLGVRPTLADRLDAVDSRVCAAFSEGPAGETGGTNHGQQQRRVNR